MRTLALFFALLSFSLATSAQQQGIYSQYYIQHSLYNPAAVGNDEQINIALFFRKEWTTFPGTPSSNLLIGDSPFNHGRMGIGLQIGQESVVATKTWLANVSYAYRINLKKGKLAFGAKLGMHQTRFNASELTIKDEQDRTLTTMVTNAITPDLGFGLHYSNKSWHAGIAMYNLTSNQFHAFENTTSAGEYNASFSLQASKNLSLNPNWNLQPSFLAVYIPNIHHLEIGNLTLSYKKELYLGTSYRSNQSMVFMLGVRLNKISSALENLRVGYSYDLNMSTLNVYLQNTHELTLSLLFDHPKSLKRESQKPSEISPYDL